MNFYGISKSNDDYWVASRYISDREGNVSSNVAYVDKNGTLNWKDVFIVSEQGDVRSYDWCSAVRPVVTIDISQ